MNIAENVDTDVNRVDARLHDDVPLGITGMCLLVVSFCIERLTSRFTGSRFNAIPTGFAGSSDANLMVVDDLLNIPSSSIYGVPASRRTRRESDVDYQRKWNSVMLDMRTAIFDGIDSTDVFGRLAPVIRNELEEVIDTAILRVGDRHGFVFDDGAFEGTGDRSRR